MRTADNLRKARGAFQLVVYVAGNAIPAHLGTIPRSEARRLQKAYREHKPHTRTKVVKALG